VSSEHDVYEEQTAVEEDNWLMSYADLLTNLLAFFVLLFAISNVQSFRWELVSKTFSKDKKRMGVHELKQKLDAFIVQGKLGKDLETQLDESGLQVRFKAKVLFESASAELSPSGSELLAPVSQMLQTLEGKHEVVVEGHADDQPIHTEKFESNWELSAKRSVNVVRRLIEAGVKRDVISAQAFADTRPMARTSQDPGDRAGDRRVVVRVR